MYQEHHHSTMRILGTAMTGGSLVLFLLVIAAMPAGAAVIRVPAHQPTIQAGIDAAVAGDTVLVADGTWTGAGNRDLDFSGKAITLLSENGPDACTIDCQGGDADRHRALHFHSSEGRDSVVEGFGIIGGFRLNGGGILCDGASPTIRGNLIEGNTALEDGGGICCWNGAAPLVDENTIHDNVAGPDDFDSRGGGVACIASSPEIVGNLIDGNFAWLGGGVFTIDASPLVSGNRFTDNAGDDGGAIACMGSGAPQVFDNQMYFNHVYGQGGAVFCHGPAALFENNLVWYNNALQDGGGFHCSAPVEIAYCTIIGNIADLNGGGIFGSGTVVHSILIGNPWEDVHGQFDITWSCVPDDWGKGNFFADPLWVTGPEGDFYLSQIAAGQAVDSPCADTGNPAAPLIGGTTRTDGVGDRHRADVGYHYPLPGNGWNTVSAGLACTPASGTLPFTTRMDVTISSNYKDQVRTAAGRIDVHLAGGQQYGSWRAGFLNLQPEEVWSTSWLQGIPLLGSLLGESVFALHVEDVTASPYNQPPYPPSGDTGTARCTVTGVPP